MRLWQHLLKQQVAPATQYATLNPADKTANVVLSNGNLSATFTAVPNSAGAVRATASKSTGQWYFEAVVTSNAASVSFGVANASFTRTSNIGLANGSIGYLAQNGIYRDGSSIAGAAQFFVGDVIGVAFDATAKTVRFYRNNTLLGSHTWSFSGAVFPATGCGGGGETAVTLRFDPASFSYSPPTGYGAITV